MVFASRWRNRTRKGSGIPMEELLHMARCSRWEHDNSRMSRGRIFPNFFCWCGRTGEYYVRRRQWNIRHSEAEHGGRISGCKRLLRRLKGNGRVFLMHAYQRLIKLRVRGELLTATRWHRKQRIVHVDLVRVTDLIYRFWKLRMTRPYLSPPPTRLTGGAYQLFLALCTHGQATP